MKVYQFTVKIDIALFHSTYHTDHSDVATALRSEGIKVNQVDAID